VEIEMSTALLIIDMQLGNFLEPYPVYQGDRLVRKVKSLIAKARLAKIQIIYVKNTGSKGDPDEYGAPGWEIHPSIKPGLIDSVIQKDSPDAFHETGLQQELESKGIERLVIAGLQTEYCVDTTCRRAYSLGYKIVLIRDAHSTWDSESLSASQIIEHHNNVLGGWFVTLKDEKDVLF
jgi:nicotinamidase-related amidase